MTLSLVLLLVGSYLLGSIPFGLWIALRLKGVDVRTLGSGNIGATNVSRICGPAIGRLVFVLDLLKGLLPPLIGKVLLHLDRPDSRYIVLASLLAILGHNFSIFLGFKGGKGISTSGGALLGAAPLVGLADGVVFIVLLLATSIISAGSIAAATALPFLMLWLYPRDWFMFAFGLAASAMALVKHRKNIERLRKGEEPRVHLYGKRDNAAPPPAAPLLEKETPPDAGH